MGSLVIFPLGPILFPLRRPILPPLVPPSRIAIPLHGRPSRRCHSVVLRPRLPSRQHCIPRPRLPFPPLNDGALNPGRRPHRLPSAARAVAFSRKVPWSSLGVRSASSRGLLWASSFVGPLSLPGRRQFHLHVATRSTGLQSSLIQMVY